MLDRYVNKVEMARCNFFPGSRVGPEMQEGPILWYYSWVLWCVRRRRADGPTLISNTEGKGHVRAFILQTL
jgi:hypothetical protein